MPADPAPLPEVGLPGRIAIIFGLAGLAVTQPMLDLFGRNPEFFIAGRYDTTSILLFALVVALLPGLAATGVMVVAQRVHPRAGFVLHVLLIAVLGALFANVVVRDMGVDRVLGTALAALVGTGATLLLNRLPPGRLLLQYLAVGNVFFLAAFVLMSPTGDLLFAAPSVDVGHVSVPPLRGPVIVVILDEFPVTTLLTDAGTINGERFPAFAELAQGATWFRNASSHHTRTHIAVPALLTGRLPKKGAIPTYRDHPRNLFTLLGADLPIERYELVTDLCPPDTCDPAPAQPLGQALRDAAVVYGHRVLPARLRTGLPAIDHAWGGFGDDLGGSADIALSEADPVDEAAVIDGRDPFARWHATPTAEKRATSQAAILVERTTSITAAPQLHFVHVALPHYPWIVSPWGTRLMAYPTRVLDEADPAYEASARLQYQLHSMQVGAADVAIGTMIDHLKDADIWDDSTVVVVSDHGIGLVAPDFGRKSTPANEQELFRVPMFVKAPGQTTGELVDAPAQSIDLLPSLIDLLGIETDWTFDGHSLFDGSSPTVEPLVGRSFAPALEVVRRHLRDVPGLDWVGLAAAGEHADLVGRHLDDFRLGSPSEITWTPDHEADFASLPTAAGAAPQLLTGVVQAPSGDPPELIVAVNGMIGGTTGGYQRVADGWSFTSYLAPYLREGSNEIRAFVVGVGTRGPVLHEVR